MWVGGLRKLMPTISKTCKRPWMPEREAQQGRRTDNSKFYQSSVWRRVRRLKLEINPFCEECERIGEIVPGRVVDHIAPIAQGGEPLAMENLQTLCDRCHNRKSGKEAHRVR